MRVCVVNGTQTDIDAIFHFKYGELSLLIWPANLHPYFFRGKKAIMLRHQWY